MADDDLREDLAKSQKEEKFFVASQHEAPRAVGCDLTEALPAVGSFLGRAHITSGAGGALCTDGFIVALERRQRGEGEDDDGDGDGDEDDDEPDDGLSDTAGEEKGEKLRVSCQLVSSALSVALVRNGQSGRASWALATEGTRVAVLSEGDAFAVPVIPPRLSICDVASGSVLATQTVSIQVAHDRSVLLSGDGSVAVAYAGSASGGACLMYRVVEDDDGAFSLVLLNQFRASSDPQFCGSLSLDGAAVVFGSGSNAMLWLADESPSAGAGDEQEPFFHLSGHQGTIYAVAMGPSGDIVLTGSVDQTIRMWDTASKECTSILYGHSSGVCALAISPDGRLAISGGRDSRLVVWDLVDESRLEKLDGHGEKWIETVTIFPDGLVVSTDENRVRCWDLNLTSPLTKAASKR